ncbi:MAG: MBL fold metallo-hydrolase [Gammaproteobacteria bacterium]|nr:MBL fold metallo-hydrolase [Gammaproteobacteria bacterium]
MNEPTMLESINSAPDIVSLVSYIPIPGYGVLPVNAFVIKAREPVLVDTGMTSVRSDFMRNLRAAIDPKDLRWIWLTHIDMDHIGNLEAVLAEAPDARVVTSFIGMAKMGLHGLPLDRVFLLNPGQALDVGDRQLLAIKPPTYDAPETTGLFDQKSSTFISADSFGAILEKPVDNAVDINSKDLREGSQLWASIDAPWLSVVDHDKFGNTLSAIEKLNADIILSSHLPPAENMCKTLLNILSKADQTPVFVGPDQHALEKMMAA